MNNTKALNVVVGGSVSPTLGSAFRTVQDKVQESSAELRHLRIGAGLARDIQQYSDNIRRLHERLRAGQGDRAKLTRDLIRAAQQKRKASEAARKYGLDLTDLAGHERRLGSAIEQTTKRLARQQRAMRNRAVRQEVHGEIIGTVATAMVVAAPLKAAIDFESVGADIKKVVNFDTPQQFKDMKKDILDLSASMPMAASGIGAIVAAAGQSGIARSELMGFANDAVKMGVAFDLTGAEAGKMMADWRAGMNLTQGQVVSLADAVNYLSNNMNAQAPALGKVLQRQGAVAMAAGLTEAQTASLGAALLSSGAPAQIAATAMKNLVGSLTMGTAATKQQQKAFEALGLDAEDMAARMQTDAKGAIIDVFQALKDASPEERGALVTQLFGEESKGAIMPLLKNLGLLQKSFDLTADSSKYAGSMMAEYRERANTTANNLRLLANRATRAGVSIGTVVLPALNSGAAVLGAVADLAATVADKFPLLTQVVVGAAVAMVGLKIATLAGRYAMTIYSDAVDAGAAAVDFLGKKTAWANDTLAVQKIRTIGSAVATRTAAVATKAWTAAQWLWNAAMSANPIGLAVAGIVAGAALVYTYWEPIKAFMGGVWDGLKFGIQPVIDALRPLSPLFSAIGAAASFIGDAVALVVGFVKQLLIPLHMSSEALGKATMAGAAFGVVLGSAVRFVLFPLKSVQEAIGWIGEKLGLLGGGKSRDSVMGGTVRRRIAAGATAAAMAVTPPALAANGVVGPSRATAQKVDNSKNYKITVHAAPGMNEKAVAEQVRRQLDERDAQSASKRRGALHD